MTKDGGRNASFVAYNTGYTAHSVRPNRLTPTSYSPKTLSSLFN